MTDTTDTARLVATVRETAAGHQTVHSQDRARKELFMQCADALERLAAENAELRKNDARYRWLRNDAHDFDPPRFLMRTAWCVVGAGYGDAMPSRGEELDEAIDAAMAEGKS